MRVKFLVLLAFVCLFANLAEAHKKKSEPKPETEVEHVEPEQVFEFEETEVITHKKEKKDKDKTSNREVKTEKKKKKKTGKPEDCNEATLDDRAACEKDTPEGYKAVFTFTDGKDCDWTCKYEAIEVATEAPKVVEKKDKKKIKKVKKDGKGGKKKDKKECEGEKKFAFSNCLVKIRGMMAFGAKVKDFDKKFDKFVQKSTKKKKKTSKK